MMRCLWTQAAPVEESHFAAGRPWVKTAVPQLNDGIRVELLEREDCLASLAEWFEDVPRTGGCVVLVGAEAGHGKTTLLREFARGLPKVRLLWGACDALFTPRPLAPVLDIARDAEGPLADAVRRKADRDELFAATLDELERQPALVVFEDLHWADEATLDFVKYLGRRVGRTRALFVITYRDDEVVPRHRCTSCWATCHASPPRRLALAPCREAAAASPARPPTGASYRITGATRCSSRKAAASHGVPARSVKRRSPARRVTAANAGLPMRSASCPPRRRNADRRLLHPSSDDVDAAWRSACAGPRTAQSRTDTNWCGVQSVASAGAKT
jgi:hypothetical protein